ncbi:hypothetical protein [Wolbachia pipientis]|uniref:hypothetical protein n=1 Tax=Wolbachia pipientis TaxID=955 RepID=UPI0025A36E5A|nr:hypothetical protein [Wolbachia pipientis]MDM8334950.1 hypothetical protein [Wolbachia pipientis]
MEGERKEKEQLEKLLREKAEKLTQEKQALESRIEEGLNRKVGQLKKQLTDAQQKDNATKELSDKDNEIQKLKSQVCALNDEKEGLLSKNAKLNM